jgi:transport and Golgi organization protein 2
VCTLIIARDVLGPGSLLLGANRDEDPRRPSDPPGVLRERPRLVGGRDRLAGGTWLAIRGGQVVVALLNRRDPQDGAPPTDRRSRGLLTLDAAAAPWESAAATGLEERDDLRVRAVLERAGASVARERYAPFSLVVATANACRLMVHPGSGAPRVAEIGPGWHVLTHAELDDPAEPRAAHLMARLASFITPTPDEAVGFVGDRLRSHGEDGGPPVCLHEGRMVTVSSSWIAMDRTGTRYFHADGPPCRNPFVDQSPLLAQAAPPGGRT